MANTFSQVYLHYVFAVKHRQAMVQEPWREELERYASGIVKNIGHKTIAIYAMPDHCHLLVGFEPKGCISDLVRDVKANSSRWINEKQFTATRFEWQAGYGVFSHGKKELDTVIEYVRNQPSHHQKHSFKEEFIGILNKIEFLYDEKYLFDWIED